MPCSRMERAGRPRHRWATREGERVGANDSTLQRITTASPSVKSEGCTSNQPDAPTGAWLQLINKRHQPFSAPHVIGVLRAKRTRQGILLHIHAVNEGRANRQKYDKQRGPVAQRQAETDKRQ